MDEIKNEEYDDGIVTMFDQDGKEVNFEFLDVIEYEGNEYAMLLPLDEEDEEGGELVILKIEAIPGNEDEENYVSVDDQDILDAVFDLFKEKHKDEYDFA